MKFALYARVSDRDQNPELQKEALLRKAKVEGWDYDYFEEQESSRRSRPVKNDVYQKLMNKEYDGVCVWRLDRWGRSSKELISEMDNLLNKGLKFISLRESIDLSTASGNLQFQMFCAFAEFERRLMGERIYAGKHKKGAKKQGRPKGSKDKKVRRKSGYHLRWSKSK